MTIYETVSFVVIAAGAITVGVKAFIDYYGVKSVSKQKEEYRCSFDKLVAQLSSDKITAQLSAAILLRRFFDIKIKYNFYMKKRSENENELNDRFFLRQETINVVSSILRTLPTGVYQKTLGDGLAYCSCFHLADLQRVNLQNIYFGNKKFRIDLSGADLFMANLSKALIENVDAHNAYLNNTILTRTTIKNSDFSYANFYGADLSNIILNQVTLKGAKFNKALNIPDEISNHLDKDGIFQSDEKVSTNKNETEKKIFFSMSGSMTHEEQATVILYEKFLRDNGFDVHKYNRDQYPKFGQLSAVKSYIQQSAGIVAFGTKQILVKEAIFRPNLSDENIWSEQWLSTPWNEIEIGMGVMLGIPILLVKDANLSKGIFDDCLSEILIDTTMADRDIENNENVKSWLSKIV